MFNPSDVEESILNFVSYDECEDSHKNYFNQKQALDLLFLKGYQNNIKMYYPTSVQLWQLTPLINTVTTLHIFS